MFAKNSLDKRLLLTVRENEAVARCDSRSREEGTSGPSRRYDEPLSDTLIQLPYQQLSIIPRFLFPPYLDG